MLTITVKRGADSTWLARFSDWDDAEMRELFPKWDGWLPTPFFGPATFECVRAKLLDINPDAEVVEVVEV